MQDPATKAKKGVRVTDYKQIKHSTYKKKITKEMNHRLSRWAQEDNLEFTVREDNYEDVEAGRKRGRTIQPLAKAPTRKRRRKTLGPQLN